jgi:hypothetical protein
MFHHNFMCRSVSHIVRIPLLYSCHLSPFIMYQNKLLQTVIYVFCVGWGISGIMVLINKLRVMLVSSTHHHWGRRHSLIASPPFRSSQVCCLPQPPGAPPGWRVGYLRAIPPKHWHSQIKKFCLLLLPLPPTL